MATRRMFSKKVTDTDTFLDMPLSTQALYFHLNMHADDDGFIGNINTIKRMVGASNDDEKLLIAKRFIIPFEESGAVVIKDWRIHNYIRKDTYSATMYSEERRKLGVSDNGSYYVDDTLTESPQVVHETSTGSRRNVDAGKVSKEIGKSKVRVSKEAGKPNEPDLQTDIRQQLTDLASVHGFSDRLTPMQLNQLLEYVTEDGMEFGVLDLALQEASNRAIRNFKYVDAILRSKLRDGIKTVPDWNNAIDDYKKQSGNTGKDIPEWLAETQAKLEGGDVA